MATQNKSPAMRFNEFTEDWNEKKFDDIFNFSTGQNIKQNQASPLFETPCVRYGELYHMYNEVIDKIINKTDLDKAELKFSVGNEILLPSAGEDPLDIGSASALTIPKVAIGRTINILSPKNDSDYSQIFVSYYINTKLKVKIASLAKGVSISNVYNSDLRDLKINLPTLTEQKKIGDFLQNLDKLITKHQTQLTKLKNLKKAMLTKMFPQKEASVPEIRFKGFDGEWEKVTLDELCSIAKSGGTPTSSNKEYYNGNIPFLSINDMTKQGKYLTKTNKSISNLGIENSASWLVPVNSIIYSMYASVGFVSINKIPLATSQAVINLILMDTVNIEFVYYYLFLYQKNIHKYIETGTQGNLNAQTVKSLMVTLPSIKEQEQIGNYFKNLDNLIANHNEQLKKLNNIKKACLNKLFVA